MGAPMGSPTCKVMVRAVGGGRGIDAGLSMSGRPSMVDELVDENIEHRIPRDCYHYSSWALNCATFLNSLWPKSNHVHGQLARSSRFDFVACASHRPSVLALDYGEQVS
jgi:hypothetical protein